MDWAAGATLVFFLLPVLPDSTNCHTSLISTSHDGTQTTCLRQRESSYQATRRRIGLFAKKGRVDLCEQGYG